MLGVSSRRSVPVGADRFASPGMSLALTRRSTPSRTLPLTQINPPQSPYFPRLHRNTVSPRLFFVSEEIVIFFFFLFLEPVVFISIVRRSGVGARSVGVPSGGGCCTFFVSPPPCWSARACQGRGSFASVALSHCPLLASPASPRLAPPMCSLPERRTSRPVSFLFICPDTSRLG